MATKAELEAELKELRKQIAETVEPEDTGGPEMPDALKDYLSTQGIEARDIAHLWEQLSKDLGQLPQNKPMLMAIAAFALGVILGRMSKS